MQGKYGREENPTRCLLMFIRRSESYVAHKGGNEETNRLSGNVAIVTGGSRGIGRGISLALAREGANVVIGYRIRKDLAENVANEVKALGPEALPIKVDVTKSEEVKEMVQKTLNKFGQIDILVNNAGTHAIGPIVDLDEGAWDNCLNVNTKGVFLCCKHVAPHMIKQRSGKIINIASTAGKTGIPSRAAYCASKFAVIGLTQVLAKELAPYNINVNAVCPGTVYTEMWDYIWEKWPMEEATSSKEYFNKIVEKKVPLGRPQTPEDIGNMVVFLCSSESRNITGQAINVCGGSEMH